MRYNMRKMGIEVVNYNLLRRGVDAAEIPAEGNAIVVCPTLSAVQSRAAINDEPCCRARLISFARKETQLLRCGKAITKPEWS